MFGYDVDTRYFPLIGISFLVFMSIYEKFAPYYSARWFSRYRSMTTKEKLQWDNKIGSTIHSVTVSTLFILCYLLEGEEFYKVKLWSESTIVKVNMCVVIGYMLADTSHMVGNSQYIGSTQFVVHHIVSIFPFLFVLTYRILNWHANFRMAAEISTFFINIRWFLDAPLQYSKTSNVYVASGIALTISFILTRIVNIPFYYYPVYSECSKYSCTPAMLFWMVAPCIVLDGLGLWWFRKVVVGFKKIIYEGWFKNVVLEKVMNGK
ncbi:TLC domain-containing protein 4-like [Lineus longissimus]|uniref:TLC domain-containing protein 4-like n=1 Tax=Lineus longissimus TaxID=88925 RepID=UPI002B4EC10E